MSRTKHARGHSHKWQLDHKLIQYLGKDRYVKAVYRCKSPGCFAAKVVRS